MGLKVTLLTLSLTLFSLQSFANTKKNVVVKKVNHSIIKTITIQKLGADRAGNQGFMDYASDCSKLGRGSKLSDFPSTGDVRIDMIINLGAKIFTLIKENAPLITTTSTSANALPMGVFCWNELEGWNIPRSDVYRITYKNAFGVNVVDFYARVIFSYGGQLDGVGRYLANATIQYKKLDVKVGYIFDASVEIPQVLNLGSAVNPVAGMQMNLNWSVTTRPIALKKEMNTQAFFVTADGRSMMLQ